MKITDFAIIFLGVTLPIIILVYINVSFTIKAGEQEMYYKKLIDSAIQDATVEMKQVENNDQEIDYGYSGTQDKKVSVNTQIAVDTFFNSLYNNFGIAGNEQAEKYLQMFVPAVAVIDYNGVQVSSIESYTKNGEQYLEHKVNPKRYYTISYDIVQNGGSYEVRWQGQKQSGDVIKSSHTLEITMDDYVTHRGSYGTGSSATEIPVKRFYVSDTNNNSDLGKGAGAQEAKIAKTVSDYVLENKTQIIANVLMEELTYSVNAHNSYAKSAGITYDFTFPATTEEELYDCVDNVGIIALVQGISIGNKYLNTKSYGVSKLELTTRYYFSLPNSESKYNLNLYHKDAKCLEYEVSSHQDITPSYVLTKQQAASATISYKGKAYSGFYPCPICRP